MTTEKLYLVTSSDGKIDGDNFKTQATTSAGKAWGIGTDGKTTLISCEGQTIQVSTMPSASQSLVGKIYEYIGTTSADYTNGYFYQCESYTTETGETAYRWTAKDVQQVDGRYLPVSGGSLTGTLRVRPTTSYGIGCSNDAENLTLYGGTAYNQGASIQLIGKDATNDAGVIKFRAYDGTDETLLKLTPSGELVLHDDSVLTTKGGYLLGKLTVLDETATATDMVVLDSNDDAHRILLEGGYNANSGAKLILSGKASTSDPGCFELDSTDGSSTYSLSGDSEGTLAWSGSKIETPASVIYESKSASTAERVIAKMSSDTDRVAILASDDWYDGAVLTLSGRKATFNPGGFDFRCNYKDPDTGTVTKTHKLLGTVDGALSWDSNVLLQSNSLYSTISGSCYKSVIGKVVDVYFSGISSTTARSSYEFCNFAGTALNTGTQNIYSASGTATSVAVSNYNGCVLFRMTFEANVAYSGKITVVLK